MPFDQVMGKFKRGQLHSGSKSGPKVKSRQQAIAIMMSEKRKAQGGKKEYQSRHMANGGLVEPVEPQEYKHGGMASMAKYHKMSQKDYDMKKHKMMKMKHGGMARKSKRGFASIPMSSPASRMGMM